MSFSFYIQGAENARLHETLGALGVDDLVVDGNDSDADWPEQAFVYQNGVSVRAIETGKDGDQIQVRVMAFSSLDDMRLATAIVEQVAVQHDATIEPEDAAAMSINDWRQQYGSDWQKTMTITSLRTLVSMYRNPEYADGVQRMWGTRAEFQVGPRLMDPLLKDPKTFGRKFFDAFKRRNYLDDEDVYQASLLGIQQDGTGKQAVFSVVSPGVPTAVSSEARFIALNHDNGGLGDEPPDQTTLTFDDFAEIADDHITWLGDGLALTDSIEGDDWSALLAAASARATGFFDREDLLQDSAEPEADQGDELLGLSMKQWNLVTSAPAALFLLVAGADGTVDQKEFDAFQEQVTAGAFGSGESEYMQLALMRAGANMGELLQHLSQRPGEELAKIVAAAQQQIAQASGAEEAGKFADALLDMGEGIAKASGGGFLGFGKKIGKEEAAVLSGLRQILK